jgi:hypothetical protein
MIFTTAIIHCIESFQQIDLSDTLYAYFVQFPVELRVSDEVLDGEAGVAVEVSATLVTSCSRPTAI